MISKPVLSDYASYSSYALAVLGYAVVVDGAASCDDGFVTRLRDVHVGAGAFCAAGTCFPSVPAQGGVGGRSSGFVDARSVVVGDGCSDAFDLSQVRVAPGGDGNDASQGVGIESVVGENLSHVRGKNWERNRAKKARVKALKQKLSGSWRPGNSGYFSSCAPEIQNSLKDSRAKMLIAKNKREEQRALEDARRNDVDSKEYIMKEVTRIAALAGNLRKRTKDTAVAGWAMTLAESVTKSAAESAPDSVPSLESVGYGKSALRSSDGSDGFVDAVRLREYKVKHDELTEYYEALDGYVPSEKDQSFRALRLDFADVSMSERDRMREEIEKDMLDKMNEARVPARYMDQMFPHLNILAC